jgi:hypothetical protein
MKSDAISHSAAGPVVAWREVFKFFPAGAGRINGSLTRNEAICLTKSDLGRLEQTDNNQDECPGNQDTGEQRLKIQLKTLKPVSEGN